MRDENPFQFSTKYLDNETQLYYYGLRYYNPGNGRWVNRDLSGEGGGKNIYQFYYNSIVNKWDLLGLEVEKDETTDAEFENATWEQSDLWKLAAYHQKGQIVPSANLITEGPSKGCYQIGVKGKPDHHFYYNNQKVKDKIDNDEKQSPKYLNTIKDHEVLHAKGSRDVWNVFVDKFNHWDGLIVGKHACTQAIVNLLTALNVQRIALTNANAEALHVREYAKMPVKRRKYIGKWKTAVGDWLNATIEVDQAVIAVFEQCKDGGKK